MTLTKRQLEAQTILSSSATHVLLAGGSRSGKTFLLTRNIVLRALKAPKSRHAVFRFRYNHVIASVFLDTFPNVMRLAYPGVTHDAHKQDGYVVFENGSELWFGGLDEEARTEKILGQEFATLYFNECSQIPYASVSMARTRMAQKVDQKIDGRPGMALPLRAWYDCNPPPKSHWTYRLFVEKRDPDTKTFISNPDQYAMLYMNPTDNLENLSSEYIKELESLPERMKTRFLYGRFADSNPNALFPDEHIDKWRVEDGVVPDFVRVVIAVDPSGSGDEDNADNDEIGIVAVGLGTDGNAYVLEDDTVKAGPATWGRVATTAYDRLSADCIVGETNFGGAMVGQTIQVARPRTNFKSVTASRGKVVRAEPISALYESGKVRHVGRLPALEDELAGFSTAGYVGERSPNRADALIWALAELFPAITAPAKKPQDSRGLWAPVESHWR